MADQGSIAGIGIEIVSVNDLPDPGADPASYDAILTPAETDYCFSQADPLPHCAARIAAKRAAAKALGRKDFSPASIEIIRFVDGSAGFRVQDLAGGIHLHLSLSHEGPLAMAVVVAESVQ